MLVALVAVLVVGAQVAWDVYGALPVEDRELQSAREFMCKQELYTSPRFFESAGFILLKSFVPEADRRAMIDFVDSVPLPTRYLCGASDTQPRECMMGHEDMVRRWPDTMQKLSETVGEWNESGLTESLNLNRWGPVRTQGCEFIAINGWRYPWSLLKGSWEWAMGATMFGVPRAISQFKSMLTEATNLPLHTGFHDWHQDGPSSDGGRFHKLFVMVDKSPPGNHTMDSFPLKNATNLIVIPTRLYYLHERRIERQSHTMGTLRKRLYEYIGRNPLYHGFDELGCTVHMDPGDALFFREDVWHRTQDMRAKRFSLIFDIQ